MSVYVLLLEGDREANSYYYYVGFSYDLERRIAQHFMGRGSLFTIEHPPVKILEVMDGTRKLENVVTIAYMCRHTYQRVRGGSWTSLELKSMPSPMAQALAIRPPQHKRSGVGVLDLLMRKQNGMEKGDDNADELVQRAVDLAKRAVLELQGEVSKVRENDVDSKPALQAYV